MKEKCLFLNYIVLVLSFVTIVLDDNGSLMFKGVLILHGVCGLSFLCNKFL